MQHCSSLQSRTVTRRGWELTEADGSGVRQSVVQQASDDVGAIMLGVVSGVVVYADKVECSLDKGSLIFCELGEPVPNP